MDDLVYHTVVKTPHGYRVGDVTVTVENEIIKGTLHLPDLKGRFSGNLRSDGRFDLAAEIEVDSTLTSCSGEGRISFHCIHISVLCDDFYYEIDGTSLRY